MRLISQRFQMRFNAFGHHIAWFTFNRGSSPQTNNAHFALLHRLPMSSL
jgi:hypothetical protein